MGDGYEGGTPPPDGPRNLAAAINGVNWLLFPLTWITVILRVITRVWISHNFGWDDAMMLFCQLTNTVGMGLVMQEIFWGLGRHRYYLKTDHYTGFLKYDFLDWCQVFITLMLCKLAICMFLLRISKFKQWRTFLYLLIAFLLLTHISLTFLFMFQCRPINRFWDSDTVPGNCWPKQVIQDIIIVQGVCSILTDVVCAGFPIILLRNMKLPKRQKIALQLLMGLGIVTGLVCTIRTVFSYQIKAEDKTWQGIPNALCRILEINLGIIAANAPMMRPLWGFCKRKWRNWRSVYGTTQRTPMSRLQWYRPPPSGPWYKRMRSNFTWHFRPPILETSSTRTVNKEEASIHEEKATLPPPMPQVPKPKAKSTWPQEYERPVNATWAKDATQPRMNESIDLPLQGVKSREWEEEGQADLEQNQVDWGSYRFH